jgi:hypothetical protein
MREGFESQLRDTENLRILTTAQNKRFVPLELRGD